MRGNLIAVTLALAVLASMLVPTAATHVRAADVTVNSASVAALPLAGVVPARAALFDKTRFLLHMGAAFYAFHHFVWARYKSGGFAKGARGRTGNFVKAALALLFAYHEVKVADGIANSSHSAILHALAAPLNNLLSLFNTDAGKLKQGNYNPSDITNLNKAVNGVGSQASSGGYAIKDIPTPVPGAS
jgi:hypothetical protein